MKVLSKPEKWVESRIACKFCHTQMEVTIDDLEFYSSRKKGEFNPNIDDEYLGIWCPTCNHFLRINNGDPSVHYWDIGRVWETVKNRIDGPTETE